MKKPQLLLIALAIFSTSLTTAKTASFTWQDELCEFKGQYNNQKYSEQQLKDTLSMLQLRHGVQLHSHSYAFHPQDIARIHLPAIHQEYRQQKKYLLGLQPVALPEFQQLKKHLLQNLEREHKHHYLTAVAFTAPQKLLIPDYDQQCLDIAKALNAKNTASLIKNAQRSAHRENQRELKLGNDPKFIAQRDQEFQSKLKTTDAVQHAKIQLIREWTNCANPYAADAESAPLEQIFRSNVFLKVKEVYCDEP